MKKLNILQKIRLYMQTHPPTIMIPYFIFQVALVAFYRHQQWAVWTVAGMAVLPFIVFGFIILTTNKWWRENKKKLLGD